MHFKVTTDTESFEYADVAKRAMGRCVKRPVVHGCFLLHEKMTFHTDTGNQIGYPGMICVVGDDHAWPVTADYFHKHYDSICNTERSCDGMRETEEAEETKA